jgi:hypothetical protein
MKELQEYYDNQGYYVKVTNEIKFNGFSVLTCEEYHPIGPSEKFDIISKNGKFYNQHFDDIVEIHKANNI